MKSILRKTTGTFGMLAALALATGCAQSGPTDQVPSEPAQKSESLNAQPNAKGDAVKKPRADRRGFGRHRGGPEMFFRAALDKLELSADQKTTIDGLLADLKKVERPADDGARKELDKSLAAAVRSGSINAASFETQYAELAKKATEHKSSFQTALNKLHETLTAEQRKALVAELQQRPGRRAAPPPDVADDDPNAPLGDDLGLSDDVPQGPMARGPQRGMRGMRGGPGMGMMRGGPGMGPGGMGMMRGLDLTEQQRTQLKDSFQKAERPDFQKKGEEMRARHQKMLEAFASDDFDAAKLMDGNDVEKQVREHAKQRVEHLATLTAILTPEQREKLATQIEQGPRFMKKR